MGREKLKSRVIRIENENSNNMSEEIYYNLMSDEVTDSPAGKVQITNSKKTDNGAGNKFSYDSGNKRGVYDEGKMNYDGKK